MSAFGEAFLSSRWKVDGIVRREASIIPNLSLEWINPSGSFNGKDRWTRSIVDPYRVGFLEFLLLRAYLLYSILNCHSMELYHFSVSAKIL